MSWVGLPKVVDAIFGISQKPLYFTYQTCSGNISLIKELFWSYFVTWRATGH